MTITPKTRTDNHGIQWCDSRSECMGAIAGLPANECDRDDAALCCSGSEGSPCPVAYRHALELSERRAAKLRTLVFALWLNDSPNSEHARAMWADLDLGPLSPELSDDS